MGGDNVNALWPSAPGAVAPFAVCGPGVAEGVRTQRMLFGGPLRAASGGSAGLIAEDKWRLDVSGVQVRRVGGWAKQMVRFSNFK